MVVVIQGTDESVQNHDTVDKGPVDRLLCLVLCRRQDLNPMHTDQQED